VGPVEFEAAGLGAHPVGRDGLSTAFADCLVTIVSMTTFVEVWHQRQSHVVALTTRRVTIGRGADTNVMIEGDASVSRVHALMERIGESWFVRDLGSRNGTLVNGKRIAGDTTLRPGDEVQVGQTRIVLRGDPPSGPRTAALSIPEAPHLTRRQFEIVAALCRPVLESARPFPEPATTREIAGQLFITEAAVKQHLAHLYDLFDLHDATQRRRIGLANAAIVRGAVTIESLRGVGGQSSSH
jgi:pSer/pThr/pTyr-binding forkhead associated (FHA) protein